MTHPVATLPKLTVKELAVLKAIDLSEYGEYLTDPIWSFTIAQNLQFTDNIKVTSIPGIVASLQKKGYTTSYAAAAANERTIQMTREGALAYVAANGGKSAKPVEYVAPEVSEVVVDPEAEAPTEVVTPTGRPVRAKKTAEEKRLAKNARAARRRAARKAKAAVAADSEEAEAALNRMYDKKI